MARALQQAPKARKAVIPAAGKGKRMNVVSAGGHKELLPVGGRPAILYALDEAVGAGLDEIAIVVSPGKLVIREVLDGLVEVGALAAKLTYVVQNEQRGLGDAVTLCREFVAGEPFGLLLPDNIFLSSEYDFGGMVALHSETGLDVVGVVELTEEFSQRFGNCGRIAFDTLRPGVLDIRDLEDKKPGRLEIEPGEWVTRTCGRYLCRPHVFEYLERTRPGYGVPGVELDEVPAYQAIIAEHGALGCVLPGPLFDTGNPLGYEAANAYLAADSV
ncbi:MAG: sugar phosphate nucleotidyltransferase [Acidobacteriota bacterium]|nr:sugar phosphate nucleotidyltransferase [Acidobacteriota bacterium]